MIIQNNVEIDKLLMKMWGVKWIMMMSAMDNDDVILDRLVKKIEFILGLMDLFVGNFCLGC